MHKKLAYSRKSAEYTINCKIGWEKRRNEPRKKIKTRSVQILTTVLTCKCSTFQQSLQNIQSITKEAK